MFLFKFSLRNAPRTKNDGDQVKKSQIKHMNSWTDGRTHNVTSWAPVGAKKPPDICCNLQPRRHLERLVRPPWGHRRDQSIRIKLGHKRPVTVPQCLCEVLSLINGVFLMPSHWLEFAGSGHFSRSKYSPYWVLSDQYLWSNQQKCKLELISIHPLIVNEQSANWKSALEASVCSLTESDVVLERRLMMIICWNPEIPWLWDLC